LEQKEAPVVEDDEEEVVRPPTGLSFNPLNPNTRT